MKRVFDIAVAALGLLLLSPLFLFVAILIKLDSPGPIFFRQERIGKRFRPFLIYKFRTMVEDAAQTGAAITYGNDPRITRAGRLLRKTKIDELPQLINVLKGEMSLVGPRPELAEFVNLYRRDFEEILTFRPGITDLASLNYHDESTILGKSADPRETYVRVILPDKIRLTKEYLQRSSLLFDMAVIFKTVLRLLQRNILS